MTATVDIYCRTATDGPETRTSLQAQEAACQAYCATHGLSVGMVHHEVSLGVIYRDRQQVSPLRKRYRDGTIQGVVVSRLDRLSRSHAQLATLMREMEAHHVTLYCATEQPGDTLMIKFIKTMYEA